MAPAVQSIDLGTVQYGRSSAVPDTGLNQLKSQVVAQIREIADETPKFDLSATHIKSSPYDDPLNFLRLTDLEQPLRLFALALTQWKAIRPDYATAQYMSTFNWDEVFRLLRALCDKSKIQWQRTELHVVIFKSKLKVDADRARLGELDQMSHQEACASGGLLHYWFGSCDGERRNLATCIWRNPQDAIAGGKGPWHRKAKGAAHKMYEGISFSMNKLVVEAGADAWYLENLEEHHH